MHQSLQTHALGADTLAAHEAFPGDEAFPCTSTYKQLAMQLFNRQYIDTLASSSLSLLLLLLLHRALYLHDL
jgi:hypothetical protein